MYSLWTSRPGAVQDFDGPAAIRARTKGSATDQRESRKGPRAIRSDPVRPRGHSAPKQSGGQDEPLVFAGNQRTDVRLYWASCLTVQRDLPAMGFAFGNNSSDMWEWTPGVRALRTANSRGGREAGYVPFRCPGHRRNLVGACRSQMERSGRQTPKSQL